MLLDANPIADVANLDKISAVLLKGKYYSRVALDKLLSDVAAAYAAQPLKELSTALDPTHLGRPLGWLWPVDLMDLSPMTSHEVNAKYRECSSSWGKSERARSFGCAQTAANQKWP